MDLEGNILQKISGNVVLENPYKKYFVHIDCFIVKKPLPQPANTFVYGLYNLKGEWLFAQDFDTLYIGMGYVFVGKKGKLGLLDFDGTQVLPFEYEEISYLYKKNDNNTRLFKVKKAGKYGILNAKNETLIPCEYSCISQDFFGNNIVVAKNDFCGVINLDNQLIIPCQYKGLKILNDSFFAFQNDCEFGLIEKSGHFSLPDTFSDILHIIDNRYMVASVGLRMGIIDLKTSEIIVPFRAEYTQFNLTKINQHIIAALFNDYPGIHGITTRRYILYNTTKHEWLNKNIYNYISHNCVQILDNILLFFRYFVQNEAFRI